MRKYKFDKPLVESQGPPHDKNVYWVDVDEKTGKLSSIKEYNSGVWQSVTKGGGSGDALELLFNVFGGTKLYGHVPVLEFDVIGNAGEEDPFEAPCSHLIEIDYTNNLEDTKTLAITTDNPWFCVWNDFYYDGEKFSPQEWIERQKEYAQSGDMWSDFVDYIDNAAITNCWNNNFKVVFVQYDPQYYIEYIMVTTLSDAELTQKIESVSPGKGYKVIDSCEISKGEEPFIVESVGNPKAITRKWQQRKQQAQIEQNL